METWRQVEVCACEELPGLLGDGNGPTPAELQEIRDATFTVEAVNERERVTDHDMAAFVDVLAASAGEAGRWIHFGLTSSDVLDTALALQLRTVGEVIVPGARALADALVTRAREHASTLCVGRTHGVHAEPTTFGVKLAGGARGGPGRSPTRCSHARASTRARCAWAARTGSMPSPRPLG